MSFPLFKDVGKNANDLLKKGYPSSEKYLFRVEYDTISSTGIQINPFLQETLDKNVEAELKTKFTLRDFQFTTTGNLKEDVSVEVVNSKPIRGLKGTVNVSSNLNDFFERIKGKATVEFKHDVTTTAFTIESNLKKSGKSDDAPKVNFSSVFGSKEQGISVGVDSEVSLSTYQPKTLNGVLSYGKSDLEVTAFAKTKVGSSVNIGTSFYHKFPSTTHDVHLGGEISHDLTSKTSAFLLGGSCRPDDFSSAKARFDSKGFLGFSYTEKWRGPLSVTFMTDWNILGAPNSVPLQYGIKLAFK